MLDFFIQSNLNNTDPYRAIESVHINRVSINGLNLEKMQEFLSPGTKKTVHNNEVSILSGCPQVGA